MNYLHPFIGVQKTKNKGLGVFAKQNLNANELIEVSQVIVLSEYDTKLIHQTKLHDYYFSWGVKQTKSAIALGYISLYNHAENPNCSHECDFEKNTISIYCKKAINKGEELHIDYNMGEKKELWFTTK